MTYIYLIRNSINNKIYIGQTRRNVRYRFMEHGRDNESALYEDMCKYGRESFTYEVLHICKDEYANQWEHYYICKYDATNEMLGYNKVDGVAYRWVKGGFNPAHTQKERERIHNYNIEHLDIITKGFKSYNESRKFPVAMIEQDGNIIRTFESLSDACRYLCMANCNTSKIKQVCDVFNKYGKRAKMYGHYWSALNKDVQTNTEDVRKAEDELPSE